jgi:hypothetical protein
MVLPLPYIKFYIEIWSFGMLASFLCHKLHGITSHNTAISVITAMRTSYIKISVFVIHSVHYTAITPTSVYGKRMPFVTHKTPNPNRAHMEALVRESYK